MYLRRAQYLIGILRRPRNVIVTIMSWLRARWEIHQSDPEIAISITVEGSDDSREKLEREMLSVAPLVSTIFEESMPRGRVTVQVQLEGDRKPAAEFLRKYGTKLAGAE